VRKAGLLVGREIAKNWQIGVGIAKLSDSALNVVVFNDRHHRQNERLRQTGLPVELL